MIVATADVVELSSGARLEGDILELTDQSVTIRTRVRDEDLTRKYPLDRVKAVVRAGRAEEVKQSPAHGGVPRAGSSALVQRSPEEVVALIERLGRTPPDWFDSTPLEYPDTLDLTWPEGTNLVWNYTRNVDHYIWDIINSNSGRYRSGVRLMHHLLVVNQKSETTRRRVMNELGRMYFEFFNDYPRAAFWWRQAVVAEDEKLSRTASPARLAECYFRLGNRQMAEEFASAIPLTSGVIKFWGDLKNMAKALALAEEGIRQGLELSEMHVLAGDACRGAERYDMALQYYEQALAVPAAGRTKAQVERSHERARGTVELIRLFDSLDVRQLKDGTFEDKSYGYAGNVYVEARVESGQIKNLRVTSLSDRQYYHAVEETIRRILDRQSVKGIDAISGATITSEAVIRASARALNQARTDPY